MQQDGSSGHKKEDRQQQQPDDPSAFSVPDAQILSFISWIAGLRVLSYAIINESTALKITSFTMDLVGLN
jgi:hypothetical protein